MRLLFSSVEEQLSNSTFQKSQTLHHTDIKLCVSTDYTYDMRVYLGKDKHNKAQGFTATHAYIHSTYQERRRMWSQIAYINFFSLLPY
jgi:hypothetical protein